MSSSSRCWPRLGAVAAAAAIPDGVGPSSSDAAEPDASEAGSPVSKQRRQRRQQRKAVSGLRREDLAFFIARSDLSWEQPWRFVQSAPLSQLRLRQQGVAGLDDAAAAEAGREPAGAAFKVQLPLGLGALVVTGSVQAAVPLRCEFCGEGFEAAVQQKFDAVIHLGGAPPEAELAANELTFGADENLCDITELVTDAVVSALPTVCLCGGGSCRQYAGREVVWSSSPSATPAPAASPFAKLLKGKH